MKKISFTKKAILLQIFLLINLISFSQITGSPSSWTTAYCNEEIGLKYQAGTVALNQRVSPTAGTGTLQPAPITINGIGSNIVVRKAFLWFSIVGQSAPVTTYTNLTLTTPLGANLAISNLVNVSSSVNQLNNNNNASGWLGTSGTNFGSGLTLNYRAEVTLPTSMTNYNGNYIINGLPTIITSNPDIDVTGATLMIIYKDNNDCKKGSLIIQDTYMKNNACYTSPLTSVCFPIPPLSTSLTRFFNIVDSEVLNYIGGLTSNDPIGGMSDVSFVGDMMNFVTFTCPFTNPSGNTLNGWDNVTSTSTEGGVSSSNFISMRGFYWQENTASSTQMTASFTVPYYTCEGSPVTMNGTASTGTIDRHMWTIVETTSNGGTIAGAVEWLGPWINGAPLASENFPTPSNGGPTFVCGKFYRIKLALNNDCQVWVETTRLIAYACKPPINFKGSTSTICAGSTGHLSVGTAPGTYNLKWIKNLPSGQQSIIYNGGLVNLVVSPTVTTTYTCILTNTVTGCSSTANFTVTVVPAMNSSFSSTLNTTNSNWFTISATMNDQTASSVAGFGYSWEIKEISTDGLNTLNYTIINPSVWQGIPLNTATTFKGFDDFNVTYSGNVTSIPSSIYAGMFLYGHHYIITRKTWNNFCPESTSVLDLNGITRAHINSSNTISSTSVEDHQSLKLSLLEEGLEISPNPSNGIFNISSANSDISSVEIYDMAGTKLRVNISNIDSKTVTFDMSGNAKGMYLLNIVSDGNVVSKKITLN